MLNPNKNKEGWLIFQTPLGKYCKIRAHRKGMIPKNWAVSKHCAWYETSGELTEMAHGLIEIVNREQAKWYGSPAAHDFGLIIGMLSDG
jgi:hypothetical protein